MSIEWCGSSSSSQNTSIVDIMYWVQDQSTTSSIDINLQVIIHASLV